MLKGCCAVLSRCCERVGNFCSRTREGDGQRAGQTARQGGQAGFNVPRNPETYEPYVNPRQQQEAAPEREAARLRMEQNLRDMQAAGIASLSVVPGSVNSRSPQSDSRSLEVSQRPAIG